MLPLGPLLLLLLYCLLEQLDGFLQEGLLTLPLCQAALLLSALANPHSKLEFLQAPLPHSEVFFQAQLLLFAPPAQSGFLPELKLKFQGLCLTFKSEALFSGELVEELLHLDVFVLVIIGSLLQSYQSSVQL